MSLEGLIEFSTIDSFNLFPRLFTNRFELSEAPDKTTIVPVIQKVLPFKNDIRRCSSCESESLRLKRCVKCYSVAYCDKQCQLKHWSCGHKITCRAISDRVVGTPFLISVPSSAKITLIELRRLINAQIRKWQSKVPFSNGDTCLDIDAERWLNRRDDSVDNNGCEVETFNINFIGSDSQKIEISCLVGENDNQHYLDFRKISCIEMLWKPNFIPADELNGNANSDFGDKFVDAFEDENGTKTLNDLLVWFSESERLQNENSWYCSTCKQHQEAEKTMQLWKLPPILIIHLKRFRYENSLFFRNKIEAPVDFPDM
uniref:ubiquitinyl hydrolase 1 n=1 Tax=Romanomermis culicivorax TaxID=13658 RepID=A0A915JJC1_ROMCU